MAYQVPLITTNLYKQDFDPIFVALLLSQVAIFYVVYMALSDDIMKHINKR